MFWYVGTQLYLQFMRVMDVTNVINDFKCNMKTSVYFMLVCDLRTHKFGYDNRNSHLNHTLMLHFHNPACTTQNWHQSATEVLWSSYLLQLIENSLSKFHKVGVNCKNKFLNSKNQFLNFSFGGHVLKSKLPAMDHNQHVGLPPTANKRWSFVLH